MKTISFLSIITMLFSCQSKNIDVQGIERITIVSNLREAVKDTVVITDEQQIKLLADVIKEAKREPVKFLADYRLELKFKDSTIILLARKNLLNNQGFTYILKDDIGKVIVDITATH